MKRLTFRYGDDDRVRFTRSGKKVYCSTQATADIIAQYEELLQSLGFEFDNNTEDVREAISAIKEFSVK